MLSEIKTAHAGSCSPCGYYATFTIASTFPPMFLRETQRPCRRVSTPRDRGKLEGGEKYLFPWEYLTIMPQCLALVRNYIPLSSRLSLGLYICDWCHCGATDNSDGNNLKRLEWRNGGTMPEQVGECLQWAADNSLWVAARWPITSSLAAADSVAGAPGVQSQDCAEVQGVHQQKKKNRKRDAFEDSECRVLKSKSLCLPVTEERRARTFRLEYFNHDSDKCRILSCLLTLEKGRIWMQLDMRVLVLILEDPQNSASLSLKTSSVSLVSYICVPMHRVDTPGKPLGQKKKKEKPSWWAQRTAVSKCSENKCKPPQSEFSTGTLHSFSVNSRQLPPPKWPQASHNDERA